MRVVRQAVASEAGVRPAGAAGGGSPGLRAAPLTRLTLSACDGAPGVPEAPVAAVNASSPYVPNLDVTLRFDLAAPAALALPAGVNATVRAEGYLSFAPLLAQSFDGVGGAIEAGGTARVKLPPITVPKPGSCRWVPHPRIRQTGHKATKRRRAVRVTPCGGAGCTFLGSARRGALGHIAPLGVWCTAEDASPTGWSMHGHRPGE